MNIFILDKGYNQLGMLSNEGANPQAPYFDDLFVQELETGADTFEFTTLSTSASESMLEIGNHIVFNFNNRQRLFAISTLELEHANGMNVIRVYAEGVGFQLLETYMGEFGEDEDGDGEIDSGEYLTYGQFLERVLADTDWSYQIVSGDLNNINMGREVTFPKGKNIYALLQDSMQVFSGVELEFRGGYSGGGLSKTIYAYANGGRGSFVGKRFEYGINVKGIKKTQEIVDEMDENVILYEGLINVDGLNVQLGYDVDFALRSHEVEELEIGDTHYIIDNDFNPPLQITARIGKIEVSFSDPTKNKCYLANFKKITGSKPDDPDGEDVEDIIDDKMDEIEDLIDEKIEEAIDYLDDKYGGGSPGDVDLEDLTAIEVNTGLLTVPLDEYNANKYGVSDESIYPGIFIDKQDLLEFIMNEINICTHIHSTVEAKYKRQGIPNFTDQTYLGIEPKIEFNNNPWYNHTFLKDEGNGDAWNSCGWKSRVGQYIVRKDVEDINGDGDVLDPGEHKTHSYNLPSLVAALLGAFQKHAGDELLHSGISDGGIDLSAYATKAWVNDAIKAIEMEVGKTIIDIEIDDNNHLIFTFSDSSTIDAGELPSGGNTGDPGGGDLPADVFEVIDGKLHIKLPINFEESANFINCGLTDDRANLNGVVGLYAMTLYCANINPVHDGSGVVQIDGDLKVTGNIISSGSGDTGGVGDTSDTITVKKIIGGNPAYGEAPKYVEIEDALAVKKIFHPEGDKSVEWESDMDVAGTLSVYQDTHISGDLHVYGQIINENGASTMSINNQEYYEEELRIRDEKIADLEARLARIEEMLNN